VAARQRGQCCHFPTADEAPHLRQVIVFTTLLNVRVFDRFDLGPRRSQEPRPGHAPHLLPPPGAQLELAENQEQVAQFLLRIVGISNRFQNFQSEHFLKPRSKSVDGDGDGAIPHPELNPSRVVFR
jgi:hypothetical protein